MTNAKRKSLRLVRRRFGRCLEYLVRSNICEALESYDISTRKIETCTDLLLKGLVSDSYYCVMLYRYFLGEVIVGFLLALGISLLFNFTLYIAFAYLIVNGILFYGRCRSVFMKKCNDKVRGK